MGSPQLRTGLSPFEIEHGLPMRLPIDQIDLSWQTEDNAKLGLHAADQAPYPALNRKGDSETLEFEPAERIRAIYQLANEQLIKVKAAQDARSNSNRPTVNFVKGDRVKVSMEHLKLPIHSLAGAKKLRGKFVGHWKVLQVHSDGAVHVDMPAYLSQVHPVIHASFLRRSAKAGTENLDGQRLDGATDLVGLFDRPAFGVKEILAHRMLRKKLQYLFGGKGAPIEENRLFLDDAAGAGRARGSLDGLGLQARLCLLPTWGSRK